MNSVTVQDSGPCSFYQAALREATSLEAGLGPKKQPGIMQVNEPAIRSNSAMYRDAYGNGESAGNTPLALSRAGSVASGQLEASPFSSQDATRQQRTARGSDDTQQENARHHDTLPGVAVVAKGPPPLHPDDPRNIHASLSRSRSGDSSRGSTPTQSRPPALPKPMGPEQVRQQLEALKQNKSPPVHQHHGRQGPFIPPPMGPDETQHTLDAIKRSKQTVNDPMTPMHPVSGVVGISYAPLQQSGSLSSPEDDHHHDAMADRNARSNSPTPHHARLYSDTGRRHNGTAGRNHFPQQQFQQQAQHHLRAQSPTRNALPIPSPASRKNSGASNEPSEVMDIGSDEHIQKIWEMDRSRSADSKGMRDSSHKGSMSRGASPDRSVNTTKSTPNFALKGLLSKLGRGPSKGSHYNTSSVDPMPSLAVERQPVAGVSERWYRGQSHNMPPQSRGSEYCARPPAAYPGDYPFEMTLEQPLVTKSTHADALEHPYSAPTGERRERLYRQPVTATQPGRHRALYRNITNPELSTGLSGTTPAAREHIRRANSFDGGSTHSGSRSSSCLDKDSSTTSDDDFRLALELSRKEAEAEKLRQKLACRMANEDGIPRSPRRGNHDSVEHFDIRDGSHGRYRQSHHDGSWMHSTQHTAPSQFGQDSEDMDEDLLLALRISAEESKASKPSKTTEPLNPDEQARILRQIQEEKERNELELALEASKAQAQSYSIPAPSSNLRLQGTNALASSRSNVRTTNDFLISQQKAMEEYERNRKQTTKEPTSGRMKDPPLSKDAEELLLRGAMETQQAISSGRAHIVKCQKCGARLQAPINYSLVYCPQCQTVSPA
jgi:hypothetical protein